jgi:Cu+-exporting ATPase
LATPAAIVAATGKAAEHGILVRSAPGFEMMRKLAALVFDKTGTLTESKPTVVKSVVVDHEKSALILQFCYSLASKSTHPLAVAVAKSLQEKDYRAMEVEDLAEKPGRGMSGQVDGRSIFFGNQAWLSENGIDISESLALVPGEADLVVFAGWDGLAQVAFILTDPIRENTKVAIDRLKSLGLKTIVASGDRHAVVQLMAKNLDIDEAYGGLSPLEKSELISKLKSQYGLVGMVGDGINDAAAMAQADVAIAMGSGSDAALAAADMVLLKGDLMKVVDSLSLSHRTIAVIQQNLFWAFCYNILAIPIAAAGYLSPMVASGAMAFSSLSVVLNSLRLRYRDL